MVGAAEARLLKLLTPGCSDFISCKGLPEETIRNAYKFILEIGGFPAKIQLSLLKWRRGES